MKKNPIEENEEKLQNENQLKTNTDAAGNKSLKFLVYFLIIAAILVAIYLITAQNNDTYRILN